MKKWHLFCCKESKEKERKANRFQQKEEPAKQLYNTQWVGAFHFFQKSEPT